MLALTLALALIQTVPAPTPRDAAMERCAEAAIAGLHPRMGMGDVTNTKFEWLQVSGDGPDWTIIGSIIEPAGKGRIAHRFTCETRGEKPPRIEFGKAIRLPK